MHLRLCQLLSALFLLGTPVFAAPALEAELLERLNRARAERGLALLEADPTLAAVATRRASTMASEGWFGLVSPQGKQVEDDLDALPYPFRLVTEKLTRSAAEIAPLVDEWMLRANDQRQSLLHPDVRRVGIGLAPVTEGRILDIVLVQPVGTAAEADTSIPLAVEAERQAFLALVAARLGEAHRPALRSDPLLDEAAQQHAQALLSALEHGQGPESIEKLADRLSEIEGRQSGMGNDLLISNDAFKVRDIQAAPSGAKRHNELSSAIVVDARTAAEALALLLSSETRPPFLEPAMTRLGVGLAVGSVENGGRAVWIVAARRG